MPQNDTDADGWKPVSSAGAFSVPDPDSGWLPLNSPAVFNSKASPPAPQGERGVVGGILAGVNRGLQGMATAVDSYGDYVDASQGFTPQRGDLLPSASAMARAVLPDTPPSDSVAKGPIFQPSNWRWYTEKGSEMVPTLLAQLGAAYATKGQSAGVQFLAFASPAAMQTAASTYQQAVDRTGNPTQAAGEATLSGIASLALQKVNFAPLLSNNATRAYFQNAILNRVTQVGVPALTSGGTNALVSVAQDATNDTLRYVQENDPKAFKDWQERYAASGVQGFAAGTVMGTAHAAAEAGHVNIAGGTKEVGNPFTGELISTDYATIANKTPVKAASAAQLEARGEATDAQDGRVPAKTSDRGTAAEPAPAAGGVEGGSGGENGPPEIGADDQAAVDAAHAEALRALKLLPAEDTWTPKKASKDTWTPIKDGWTPKTGAPDAGKVESSTAVDSERGGEGDAGGGRPKGVAGSEQGAGPAGASEPGGENPPRGGKPEGEGAVEPQGGAKLDEGVKRTKRQEQIAMPSIPMKDLPTEKPNAANALHLGAMDANGDLVPVKVWRDGNRVNYEGVDGKMRGSGPYMDSFKQIPKNEIPNPAQRAMASADFAAEDKAARDEAASRLPLTPARTEKLKAESDAAIAAADKLSSGGTPNLAETQKAEYGEKNPKMLYHSSPIENRRSIEKNGLTVASDKATSGAIYFSDTKPKSKDGFDTWAVDPKGLKEVHGLEEDSTTIPENEKEKFYAVYADVHPENIKREKSPAPVGASEARRGAANDTKAAATIQGKRGSLKKPKPEVQAPAEAPKDPFAGEKLRLVNRESGAGDQTPPKVEAKGVKGEQLKMAWSEVADAGKTALNEAKNTLLGRSDPNTLMSGPPQKLAEAVVNFGVKVVKALAVTGKHGFAEFVKWVSRNADPIVRNEILGRARRYYNAIREHPETIAHGIQNTMTPDEQIPKGLKGFQEIAKIAKLPPEVKEVREAQREITNAADAKKAALEDAADANRAATAAQDEPRTIKLSDAIKAGMVMRAKSEQAISKLKGMAALGEEVRQQIAGYAKELPREVRPDLLDRIAKAKTVSDLKNALDKMDRALETYNQRNAATDLLASIGGRKSTPAEKPETPILDRINESIRPEEDKFSEDHINPDQLAPHYKAGLEPLVAAIRNTGRIEGAEHLADFLQAETEAGRSNAFGPGDLDRLRAMEGKELRGRSPDTFRSPSEAAKLGPTAGITADDTVLLHRAMQHTKFLNEKWVQDGKNWRNRDLAARQDQIVQQVKANAEPMPESGKPGSLRRPANPEKGFIRRVAGDVQRSISTLASSVGGGRGSELAKLAYDDLVGSAGKSGESKTLSLINEGKDMLAAVEKENGWKPADIIRMSNKTERITVAALEGEPEGRAYVELTPMERMKFALQWGDPDTRAIMLKERAPILPDGFRGTERHNIPIDQARASAILESMTPEERRYVSAISKFNGERIRKEGNAVRLREVGFEDWDNPGHDHRRRDLSQEPRNIRPDQQGFFRNWLESMGRLKEREGGNKPILIGNAREQFLTDLDANARYIGLSEPVRNLVETLGNPEVRQAIEGRAGRAWTNKVLDIAQKASGTQPKGGALLAFTRTVRSNTAQGILGFKASSPLTHAIGGLLEMTEFARSSPADTLRFMKQLANPGNILDAAAVRELKQDPYFNDRWRQDSGDLESPVNRSSADQIAKSGLGRFIKNTGKAATVLLKFSDQRIAVAAYKAWQEVYTASHPGAPEAEVEEWARNRASDTIRRTGTVSSPLDMAYHQMALNEMPVANFLTLFTSKMSKMRNVLDEALSDARRNPGTKTAGVLATSTAAVLATALAVSMNRAMFARLKGTADPDKKKEAQNTGVEALSELADVGTFGGGPVVRGIASLASHGQLSVLDEAAVPAQIIKGAQAAKSAIDQATRKGSVKQKPGSPAEAVKDAIRAVAKFATLFGVPLDAPEEYVEGILKALQPKMAHK